MEYIKIISLRKTDSTISFLREYEGEEGELMTVAVADWQAAGRGQGSNTWESEAGQNLLIGLKVYPAGVPAARQYVMLEAESLAVRDVLSAYTGGITIKWPNDVYWRDMKISGTLSECTVSRGRIGSCIIGTGININQRRFMSDAPNPVSLCMATGHDTDRNEVLRAFIKRFEKYLGMVNAGLYDEIDSMYAASLYRRKGLFAYKDSKGVFMAELDRVEPDGHLVLRRDDGRLGRYAFKEVKYVIEESGQL